MRLTLRDDIQDILFDGNIFWYEMRNSTILITGATGLIGSILVRSLSVATAEHNLNIWIIVQSRNTKKGEALVQEFGVKFIAGDIHKPSLFADITDNPDYIFHCATITKSADMASKPIDFITTNADGTRNMLELVYRRGCRSLVYLSFMEIYG